MSNQTYIKLNDGNIIPQIGIGVYQVPDGKPTIDAVSNALAQGYRHIDTAHAYQNERGVGDAVRMSNIPRKDIWITTKLWPTEYGSGRTTAEIDKMLDRLQTDYIDLLLLHQQVGDYMGAYKEMEEAVHAGKVRSIGLSNFESSRLEEVLESSTIKPSVLQVECHPYYQQRDLKRRIASYGTKIEAWYPLGHGNSEMLKNPVITRIANNHGKSNAQVILRWHIQEGNIIFPRSTNPDHIRDNFNIFDFELTDDEMNKMRSLDKNTRFFNMPLSQQETTFMQFHPAD